MHIYTDRYQITFSPKGNIIKLVNNMNNLNVVQNESTSFALPFDQSTQERERTIRLKLLNEQNNQVSFNGKNVKQFYQFYDDYFMIHTVFSQQKGPRMGVNFDFAFLDCDDDGFENKLMLTEMYIDPNYLYAYFLFRQYNGQYIVMAINERLDRKSTRLNSSHVASSYA